MTQKFGAQRKRAFLTYLSQSGNQTLSAERARVSRSWVQLHRSSDAEFDAACRAAIEEAREALGRVAHPNPALAAGKAANWRYLAGHELVLREACGRRVQIGRARLKQWTPRVEDRFLSTLAATCNVRAASAEVGMGTTAAYHHRDRWPDFARRWDEALETGYVRLEAALVENACHLSGPRETPPDVDMPPVTFDQALHLLNRHRYHLRGLGKRPGKAPRVAGPDEVERELRRALRRMDSWLARQGAKSSPQEF